MSSGSRFSRLVDWIRQPEYTGRNRCVPCTIVNVAFAAVFGLALAAISGPLGLAVFAAGISLIYLRGYLVPGTPTLTKRYLPDRVLELFDKGPDPRPRSSPSSALDPGEGGAATADPERLLRSLDAVEPCESEDDLCLTDAFESAWYARMDLEDGPGADAVARLVDAPEESIRIHGTSDGGDGDGGGRGSVSVSVSSHSGLSSNPTPDPDSDQGSASADGQRSGRWHQWPSLGALAVDVAAAEGLRSRSADWGTLPVEQRLGILSALRMFLEHCPRCDAPIAPGSETVESCCRSWEVIAVTCGECGERYLELDPERLGLD